MIDSSEKRNRQLAFELQNSHGCEKRSKTPYKCVLLVGVPFFTFQVCDGFLILIFLVLDEVICTHKVPCIFLATPN